MMTNDELKKKIVDVLIKVDEYVRNEIIKATEEHKAFLTGDNQYYYIVADALIAAGIGDVSELKNHRVVAENSLIPEDGNGYVLPNTPNFCDYKGCDNTTQQFCCGCKEMIERENRKEYYVIREKPFELKDLPKIGKKYFTTCDAAEARLAELNGGKK